MSLQSCKISGITEMNNERSEVSQVRGVRSAAQGVITVAGPARGGWEPNVTGYGRQAERGRRESPAAASRAVGSRESWTVSRSWAAHRRLDRAGHSSSARAVGGESYLRCFTTGSINICNQF